MARAQQGYFQQEVNYRIQASLNDKTHSIRGTEEMEYVNHSPDALSFIWIHLWPNAYKDDNTAFARQVRSEKDGGSRMRALKDRGYIDSLSFTVDGQPARTQADPENSDVVKLLLPRPLAAGEKITIRTPFYVKLPTYVSRSGHDGQNYMICQWYPKPAVYDRKGWHPMPYLDKGEFFSEYGRFTVDITLPSDYIVGATGTLQTEGELKQYKAMGAANVAANSTTNTTRYVTDGATKTLRYTAENVPDFAWFASKKFVVRYDTLKLDNAVVDVFTYHHPDGNPTWTKSTSFVKESTREYSRYLGNYAYPVVQAVEGPKNEMSGGMEYPMITLITEPEASSEELDAVIAHEVGHNWLAIMLGSDERTYAWMDEGLNTYYEFRYEAEKYHYNSIFGKQLPMEMRLKPVEEFQAAVYQALNAIPAKPAIDMPSTAFKNEEEYNIVTYIKTSVWMYIMELQLGREAFDRAMQAYFREWQFKHPYPEDLKAVLQRETGKDMEPFFQLLKKEGNL